MIRDARCFLENGATAAHLFVSEDLPVGDTVGVLGVLGDPGPQGDIELRLQEHDSPVTFSAYSKNLTLIRPLDKEGIDGPASVYVNVICERKHTLDPVGLTYPLYSTYTINILRNVVVLITRICCRVSWYQSIFAWLMPMIMHLNL